MRIHLVGVCGMGMGPLAGLLQAGGHDVSGSDATFDPPMGPALQRWGVTCREGFDPAHLEPRPDLVIIGNVCRASNPLAQAAIAQGIAYRDMAHALAELVLPGTSPLVVAGTHGKTTTSTLATWLLQQAGRRPGFLVGGMPKNFPDSFGWPATTRKLPRAGIDGDGAERRKTPFVVEGDEYDSAFFEKTPKFWHYQPEVAIVTSVEHDHIDIYPDEERYFDAFRGFLTRVPPHGLVVAAAHDPNVVRLVRETVRAPVAWYALEGDDTGDVTPDWLAAPSGSTAAGQTFDLFLGGTSAKRFGLTVPGWHNVRNAVAALAAAVQGYGVGLHELRAPLAQFAGVARRQELLGAPRGIFVYDDFAHHPRAVHETLRALAQRHPGARVIAVFEPRSATACRDLHQHEYAQSFGAASLVVLAPLGRAIAEGGLDLPRLAADLTKRGRDVMLARDHTDLIERVAESARLGDVIVTMSNGAFGGVPQRLVERLAEA